MTLTEDVAVFVLTLLLAPGVGAFAAMSSLRLLAVFLKQLFFQAYYYRLGTGVWIRRDSSLSVLVFYKDQGEVCQIH